MILGLRISENDIFNFATMIFEDNRAAIRITNRIPALAQKIGSGGAICPDIKYSKVGRISKQSITAAFVDIGKRAL